MKKIIVWSLVVILILAIALWGSIMSNVEQPKYNIITQSNNIELREYKPMLVAETKVIGPRKEAIVKGFRIIADYIFGNNKANNKISMTSPVMQAQGQEIAMTSPVLQQGESGEWIVRFVMPSRYTLKTLPKPNNQAVVIKEISVKRFVAIKFSGFASDKNLESHKKELMDYLNQNKIVSVSPPFYAFYNPPWTLPFLRRNEVMVEVKEELGIGKGF